MLAQLLASAPPALNPPPVPTGPIDWLHEFRRFSSQHLICVLACFAIMIGISLLGRSLRGKPAGDKLRITVGLFGIAYWIGSNLWWALGPNYSFAQSLPLQVCDIAGIVGPLALLTRNRVLRAVLYFWGLALSIQGFIQPTLQPEKGAATVEFWLFWANHTVIVGTALYDLIALDFRPRLRDYRNIVIWSFAYLAIIIPFDVIFTVNYGYVGPDDPINHQKTIIDALGPWPWRIIPVVLLGFIGMAVLLVPWLLLDRSSRARQSTPSAP